MSKSSQAFRTIREVADWLDVAAHVLRFWESKFPQIKPVKRAGGRRYYRPADMELVGGIKVLLHDRGMTIRGVQKMLREDGVAAVAALSPPIEHDDAGEVIEGDATTAAWIEDAASDRPEPTPDVPEQALEPDPEAEKVEPAEADIPERQPELALTPEAPPAEDAVPHAAPGTGEGLARLSGRLAGPSPLPSAALARLRPALVALRDRMRADPPA